MVSNKVTIWRTVWHPPTKKTQEYSPPPPPGTAAQIALKLIRRKRNQHQISIFIYLFIYSKPFAIQTLKLPLCETCRHFSSQDRRLLSYSTLAGYISFHLQVFHEVRTLNIYYSFTSKFLQLSPVQKLRTVVKCSTNLQHSFTSKFLRLTPVQHNTELRTVHESFKTLSVITAKSKANNRVDSTVPYRHIVGDIIV